MIKALSRIGFAAALVIPAFVPTYVAAEQQLYRDGHVLVRYNGIESNQVEAIATVLKSTRQVAIERYGFDMPETISVTVDCEPGNKVRLFNDGQDRLNLSLRSSEQLRPPAQSGIFHLYGLCHEVGHLAMYRAIPGHDWLNTAGAEGWAHFIGSEMVDGVYDALGESAWCYPYDYEQDGTARLDIQLTKPNPGDITLAAGMWRELVSIIGPEKIAPLFQAWGDAEIDPTDPGSKLRSILLEVQDDEKVADWWNRAEPLMIRVQPRSGFEPRTAKPTELMRKPVDLALDDGKANNKRSIAGGGHAVTFEAPGPGWYLTQVRIFGDRYGHPRPPAEDFSVWLCDDRGQVIREFKFPYSTFKRGNPQWVMLRTDPTETPEKFTICVGFNPTGTKGVYVYHDAEGDGGGSSTGLPGRLGDPMPQSDWLIRAVIDQRKDADALQQ